MRRQPHESNTNSPDISIDATTPDPETDDDDSKTRKSYTNLTLFIRNLTTRFRLFWPCVIIVIVSVPLLLIPVLLTRSRALVCTPFDHTSRLGLFGFGGMDSEFGSLGVPWCKYLTLRLYNTFLFLFVLC